MLLIHVDFGLLSSLFGKCDFTSFPQNSKNQFWIYLLDSNNNNIHNDLSCWRVDVYSVISNNTTVNNEEFIRRGPPPSHPP